MSRSREGIKGHYCFPAYSKEAESTAERCAAMTSAAFDDDVKITSAQHLEEIAAIAILLARNGYIMGQTISANGGWYKS